MIFFLVLLNLLLGLVSAKVPEYGTASQCAQGAHVIAVRGSNEPQGPGLIGEIANRVIERIPGSDMESLVYPALYEPYIESQTEGVAAMTQLVRDYAKQCPDTRTVILGFSQGAHVTMDVMCGTSSDGFPSTMPQPAYVHEQVAAIILLGDPSLTEGQPFHVGSSQGSGIFPRRRPDGCHGIVDKTVSICDAGDPFCEAGGHDLAVHMGYVAVWADFAVNQTVALYH
ncbi:hypothetical protein FSARC_8169 [Fusarium sarcochroum]|uniref:Acetylxylan esterase 2 n=1 Tax=Fusarium sarcochroum TaxID=1208366 RepID=A0A8H4TTU9_9HYPO|nr:hypothetical protein FSARC_8169 [Fusarium sarcochroum]